MITIIFTSVRLVYTLPSIAIKVTISPRIPPLRQPIGISRARNTHSESRIIIFKIVEWTILIRHTALLHRQYVYVRCQAIKIIYINFVYSTLIYWDRVNDCLLLYYSIWLCWSILLRLCVITMLLCCYYYLLTYSFYAKYILCIYSFYAKRILMYAMFRAIFIWKLWTMI